MWLGFTPVIFIFLSVLAGAIQGDVNRIDNHQEKKLSPKPNVIALCSLFLHAWLLYVYVEQVQYIQLLGVHISDFLGNAPSRLISFQFMLFHWIIALLLTRAYFVCIEYDRGVYNGRQELHDISDELPLLKLIEFILRIGIVVFVFLSVSAIFPSVHTGSSDLLAPFERICNSSKEIPVQFRLCMESEIAFYGDPSKGFRGISSTAPINVADILANYKDKISPLMYLFGLMLLWPLAFLLAINSKKKNLIAELSKLNYKARKNKSELSLVKILEQKVKFLKKQRFAFTLQIVIALSAIISLLSTNTWIGFATEELTLFEDFIGSASEHSRSINLFYFAIASVTFSSIVFTFSFYKVIADFSGAYRTIRRTQFYTQSD